LKIKAEVEKDPNKEDNTAAQPIQAQPVPVPPATQGN